MSLRRHLTAVLIFATATSAASESSACCLTDWLFGRSRTPHVVGFPPTHAAGFAPASVITTPSPHMSGFAPTSAWMPSGAPIFMQPASPRYQISGVVQAQRPVHFDNPSVFTGLPVTSTQPLWPSAVNSGTAQTSFSLPMTTSATPLTGSVALPPGSVPVAPRSVPLTRSLRGNAPTSSFYMGGNSYPVQSSGTAYAAGFGSATGAPATAMPPTAVSPPFTAAAPARPACGLSRFFGSLCGTGYQTSFYRAPVTFYRPITTIDPVSGANVITQQPCTSYLDQIQQTPTRILGGTTPSFAPSASPYTGSGATSYGPTTQASGTFSPSDQTVIPIPSIPPANGSVSSGYPNTSYPNSGQSNGYSAETQAPNTQPLNGSTWQPYRDPNSGDQAPLAQPQLNSTPSSQWDADKAQNDIDRYLDDNRVEPAENAAPSAIGPPAGLDTTAPPAWRLQNPGDSSVFGSSQSTRSADQMISSSSDTRAAAPVYSNAEPIQAPPSYQSPFSRPTRPYDDESSSGERNRRSVTAPPLPPARVSQPINTSTRDYGPSNVPVREAGMVQQQSYRQEISQPNESRNRDRATQSPSSSGRESGWYALPPAR